MFNFIKNICINYQSTFSFRYLSTLWLLQKQEGRQSELWSLHHFDVYDTYYIWFIAYLGILYIHLLIYFQNSNNLWAYNFRTLLFSVHIRRKYPLWSWAESKVGRNWRGEINLMRITNFPLRLATRQLNIWI